MTQIPHVCVVWKFAEWDTNFGVVLVIQWDSKLRPLSTGLAYDQGCGSQWSSMSLAALGSNSCYTGHECVTLPLGYRGTQLIRKESRTMILNDDFYGMRYLDCTSSLQPSI
ncbi:hypothetical protein TNCV_146771 [Trichonephila clavipes]|nr:hypothetical protein TNCV_146771 [Trichonephila clavipes]